MNILFTSLIIVGLSLIGVWGDYFIKMSGNHPEKYIDYKYFIIGLLLFSSTAIGWFFVMKHIKLSTLGVIYGVTTILALTLIGTLFFKENLNFYEIIGLILGLSSIFLLVRFS